MLSACCMFAASCGGGNAFVFLSVRMKGNGDGSISRCERKDTDVYQQERLYGSGQKESGERGGGAGWD